MKTEKKIIDVCCSGRMFWFDKQNPDVLFSDIREEEHLFNDGHLLTIKPDVVADFRNLPFEDEQFKLVVFDPPHVEGLQPTSIMAKKYGVLSFDWRTHIREGFNECFRVLQNDGILIFKWAETQVKVNEVLQLTNQKPLFGHRTAKSGNTIWLCFMKRGESN
jgi:ubiquinone/menaquinone biosynthesis C-methylase UbiE